MRERGSAGVYVYEIMTPRNLGGLGIAQYTARIWGLRHNKGHDIRNPKPGWFVLVEPLPEPTVASQTRLV